MRFRAPGSIAVITLVLACGGRSLRDGSDGSDGTGPAASGGAGNAGTGGAGGGGNEGNQGGTGAIGGGHAGGPCGDADSTVSDPTGIHTKAIATDSFTEFVDYCDADGNLVEYYCETNCSAGLDDAPQPPEDGRTWDLASSCYTLGRIAPLVVTCEDVCDSCTCLGGACVVLVY
jgi:hypothetical protein